MNNQDRRKRLLRLLALHGAATVADLAQWLGTSASTIRRDLRMLDLSGQIERMHGGARHVDVCRATALKGGSFVVGVRRHPQRKFAIARHAASMCADGDTILIGGGTTVCGMTGFLVDRCMRILTNSFEVARVLLGTSDNEVILSGGTIHADEKLILSPFDSEAIQYCYADKLFMGAHGLSALGVLEADPLLVQAGRRLINQAQQIIVLADSSKFANKGGMFLCGLERVSCVVTDSDVPASAVRMLEQAGIEVKVVAPDPFPGMDGGDVVSAGRSDRSPPLPPAPH